MDEEDRIIRRVNEEISSMQLHRELGITVKSAWFLSHRISLYCINAPLVNRNVSQESTFTLFMLGEEPTL